MHVGSVTWSQLNLPSPLVLSSDRVSSIYFIYSVLRKYSEHQMGLSKRLFNLVVGSIFRET